jgi:hypothetical protein
MPSTTDLLGIWHGAAMFRGGMQSREVLVFKKDGTGFLELYDHTQGLTEYQTPCTATAGARCCRGPDLLLLLRMLPVLAGQGKRSEGGVVRRLGSGPPGVVVMGPPPEAGQRRRS